MKNVRIDKFLADNLNITRSEAQKLIKDKLIKMGGIVIKDPSIKVVGKVSYLDKVIENEEYSYYILNKPVGFVSSTSSKDGKSVLELINGRKDLKILGRLDIDTTGLLIITNDGSFIHKVTSPKSDINKKYYVEVDKEFKYEYINEFKKGLDISIDGEIYHTKESILEIIDSNSAYITISEGKYHQIKKMCAKFNLNVTKLHRIQIGSLILDSNLKEGEYKKVDIKELNKIFE